MGNSLVYRNRWLTVAKGKAGSPVVATNGFCSGVMLSRISQAVSKDWDF